MNRTLYLTLGAVLSFLFACSGQDPEPRTYGSEGAPQSGGQGAVASGGAEMSGSGGAPPSTGGSLPNSGGAALATGGARTDAGGAAAEAGSGGFDGQEVHVAVDDCDETSTSSFDLSGESGQFGIAEVEVDGGTKSYIMATNWWSSYNGQSITGTGNNFTITGGAGDANIAEGAPAGYPTLYLGSYNGHSSEGSNLPKKVDELQAVPTVFRTNGTQFGMDYYNAAYDVWLTATEAGVPNQQYDPGEGGAYLMVWTFDPHDKRPRGPSDDPQFSDVLVPGVTGRWDVWVDATDPPCISYVATEPVDDLGFDLKHFIDDSVAQGYGITNEMYLAIVFAGFEVWSGGDGLKTEEFCVSVQ